MVLKSPSLVFFGPAPEPEEPKVVPQRVQSDMDLKQRLHAAFRSEFRGNADEELYFALHNDYEAEFRPGPGGYYGRVVPIIQSTMTGKGN